MLCRCWCEALGIDLHHHLTWNLRIWGFSSYFQYHRQTMVLGLLYFNWSTHNFSGIIICCKCLYCHINCWGFHHQIYYVYIMAIIYSICSLIIIDNGYQANYHPFYSLSYNHWSIIDFCYRIPHNHNSSSSQYNHNDNHTYFPLHYLSLIDLSASQYHHPSNYSGKGWYYSMKSFVSYWKRLTTLKVYIGGVIIL